MNEAETTTSAPGEGPGTLQSRVTGLRATLKQAAGQLKAQDRALSDLARAAKDDDLPGMALSLSRINPDELDALGAGEAARELVSGARTLLEGLRVAQRRELARELRAACAAAGREFGLLTENPPEFRVAPFSVVVDPASMQATLRYAREDLDQVPARAPAILAAAQKAEKELTARQEPPEQLLDLLLKAYRAALGASGRPPGQWVELCDVLPQVALARQAATFARDPQPRTFRAYPRARFLYDLARLRALRALERDGLRLELGTATGDSVRHKERVFYLEDAAGQGQYHLTLRFAARPGGHDAPPNLRRDDHG